MYVETSDIKGTTTAINNRQLKVNKFIYAYILTHTHTHTHTHIYIYIYIYISKKLSISCINFCYTKPNTRIVDCGSTNLSTDILFLKMKSSSL